MDNHHHNPAAVVGYVALCAALTLAGAIMFALSWGEWVMLR